MQESHGVPGFEFVQQHDQRAAGSEPLEGQDELGNAEADGLGGGLAVDGSRVCAEDLAVAEGEVEGLAEVWADGSEA